MPRRVPDHRVDNINACHTDNCVDNLRWVSGDENLVFAAERGIGRRRCPIVGFKADGDVVLFESISIARKSGFSTVRTSLVNPDISCRGYFFVYAEDFDEHVMEK